MLEIIANGSTLTVKLDGVQLWSGALTSGTIAMYGLLGGGRFSNYARKDQEALLKGRVPRRYSKS